MFQGKETAPQGVKPTLNPFKGEKSQRGVSATDMQQTLMPELDKQLGNLSEPGGLELVLSDGRIIHAQAKDNSESISVFTPYERIRKGNLPEIKFKLIGFHLLNGKIDEYRYGDLVIPKRTMDANSTIISGSQVDSYRPQIKEIQALVEEYSEPLQEASLREIREYD